MHSRQEVKLLQVLASCVVVLGAPKVRGWHHLQKTSW